MLLVLHKSLRIVSLLVSKTVVMLVSKTMMMVKTMTWISTLKPSLEGYSAD